MKARIIITAICFSLFSFANAQEQEQTQEQKQEQTSKIRYSMITEGGMLTASPWSIALEATSVNGISINKHHLVGLGIGIGFSMNKNYSDGGVPYTPVFLNYRYRFNPDKKFSPHINVAAGSLIMEDGVGAYSAFTAGFTAGKFSFSSGLSLFALNGYARKTYTFYDPYYSSVTIAEEKWFYPFGFVVKVGFAF